MRKGVSMIELVISIVIMGIVVASLPTVILQTQNNLSYAMQQEVITATKAKIGYILAYDWDANSYDSSSGYLRPLSTDGIASANDAFNSIGSTPPRRVGHILGNRRQRLSSSTPTPPASFTSTSNISSGYPDIDDFDSKNESVTIDSTEYDRIFGINQKSSVDYVSDSPVSGSYNDSTVNFGFRTSIASNITNIKMLQVQTTGTDINITLRAYASNIGESRPLEQAW